MSARRPSGTPEPLDPDFGADTRAESLWPDTLRPAGTSFSTTRFDSAPEALERERARLRALFNLCHRAVLLRGALTVQAVVALGVLLSSAPGEMASDLATSAAVALGATLAWTAAVCALKGLLSQGSEKLRTGALAALGAAAAVLAMAGAAAMPGGPEPGAVQWLGLALAGGLTALAAAAWMTRAVRPEPATADGDDIRRTDPANPALGAAFLYDAVSAAQALVRSDAARAEAVLNDLAALLQPVAHEHETGARLADEIDRAQRYLGIEQVRYGQRLRAACEVDPQAADALLPVLALPALAAHAARQAVEAATEGGEVTLRAQARADRVVVLVSHTVADDEPADSARELLDSLRERLRLLHDVSGQCEAWREAGAHHVRLVVPR